MTITDPILVNDWHIACPSGAVTADRPVGVTLLGEKVVLWRSKAGVRAWKDLCIHRGAHLSLGRVVGECLVCPYHGWHYDSDGACVHIPAQPERAIPGKARAIAYHAKEHLGFVWVCLGVPKADPPPFPEFGDPRFRCVPCGPYRFYAHGPRAIENFLDVSHLGFVHEGSLGDAAHTQIEDYEAEIMPDGVVADGISVWQPDPDGRGQGAYVCYRYEVLRPLTARLSKGFDGSRFALFFAVTPVDTDYCDGWMIIAMDYPTPQTDAEIRAFEDMVVAQDIPIVESQRPELLPLDLQAELSLRSDRMSIAYRQWLRAIGLTYGTA